MALLCFATSLSLSSPFPSCFLAGKERTAKRPKAYGGERSPQPCVLLSPPTQKYFTMMSPVLVRRLLDANLTLSLPQPSHDSVVFVGLSVFMPQQQGSFICVGALMTDTLLVAKALQSYFTTDHTPFLQSPCFRPNVYSLHLQCKVCVHCSKLTNGDAVGDVPNPICRNRGEKYILSCKA